MPNVKSGTITSSTPTSAQPCTASTSRAAVPPTAGRGATRAIRLSIFAVSSPRKNSACVERAIVAGSRPMSAHAASRAFERSASSAGSDHMFHSSAWRATTPIIRSPLPPIRIGSGSCTGFGSITASVSR